MTVHVPLPRLVGSREAADDLLEPYLDELAGADLEVDCRELLTASPSFADQLVESSLQAARVRRLILLAPPPGFQVDVAAAVTRRDRLDQLVVVPAAELGTGAYGDALAPVHLAK